MKKDGSISFYGLKFRTIVRIVFSKYGAVCVSPSVVGGLIFLSVRIETTDNIFLGLRVVRE